MNPVTDYKGNTYGSLMEMFKAYGLNANKVRTNPRRYSLEDALTIAPKKAAITGIEQVQRKLAEIRGFNKSNA